jgi:hypothetical protein
LHELTPDARVLARIAQMVTYQCASRRPDGRFKHTGYQVGETRGDCLIHNVFPCAMLAETCLVVGHRLPGELRARVDRTIREVLASQVEVRGETANENTCANQDYCRVWAWLLHMDAFQHREWDPLVVRSLDYLARRFHVPEVPDPQCTGVRRDLAHLGYIEPAEYYGMIIEPLRCAARRYGRKDYLDQALAIARHIVRSVWRDQAGQLRAHRDWREVAGRWRRCDEPMLIAGMGLTIGAISNLERDLSGDSELRAYVEGMNRTFVRYQSEAGFFVPASGWGSEHDVVPAVAWTSHDAFYLTRLERGPIEWESVLTPEPRAAVVFGQTCMWIETPTYWAIRGYDSIHGLELIGRKDRPKFRVHVYEWYVPADAEIESLKMPDEPHFALAEGKIFQTGGRRDVISIVGAVRHVLAGERS